MEEILNDSNDDGDFYDEVTTDEDEVIQQELHNTNDTDVGSEFSIDSVVDNVSHTSKNGEIEWFEQAPPQSGRLRTENIINIRPGPTSLSTKYISDVKSSFDLLLSDDIKKIIVEMSNRKGLLAFGVNWKSLCQIELEAYLGLTLLAGVYKSHGENLEQLWNEKDGRPIFRATMPLQRFKSISRCLRFDNDDDREQRKQRDKLAPIRNIWDKWNKRLRLYLNPGENLTVDEQLVSFRGRCSFRQYIPSKPAKYGIKIWALCDCESKYAWNLQVYLGRDRNTHSEKNQGMDFFCV